MNRRGFLRSILGTAAASAVAPSLVWPFRKIFLPTPQIFTPTLVDLQRFHLEAMEAYYLNGLAVYESNPFAQYKMNGISRTQFEPVEEKYRACADAANAAMRVIDVDHENKIVTFGDFKRGYRG